MSGLHGAELQPTRPRCRRRHEGLSGPPCGCSGALKTGLVAAKGGGGRKGAEGGCEEGVGDRYNPAHKNLSGWDLFLCCEGG